MKIAKDNKILGYFQIYMKFEPEDPELKDQTRYMELNMDFGIPPTSEQLNEWLAGYAEACEKVSGISPLIGSFISKEEYQAGIVGYDTHTMSFGSQTEAELQS